MTQNAPPTTTTVPVVVSTAQRFFEETPPGGNGSFEIRQEHLSFANNLSRYRAFFPDVVLHCDDATCAGRRTFHSTSPVEITSGTTHVFACYRCRNCQRILKWFALRISSDGENVKVYKVGEFPPFGPPTPARLTTLVGSERDYFFKGRRAESQNMGIAAFAYYRRVIENQRDRIFDAIISVAEQLHSGSDMIDDLRAAKRETQFSNGVDRIKHGIPPALLINGHNPLKLLHSALSEGLHALSDEECLDVARSIRLVMTDLAERLAAAVKDEAELTAAVAKLLKPHAAKG